MSATIHPYFVAKAEQVFSHAGGDPALAGHLAEWAADVHSRGAAGHRDRVVVDRDGAIVAEARHSRGTVSRPGAAYVTSVTDDDDRDVVGLELGMAVARLGRTRRPVIVVTSSDVCTGTGPSSP